MPDVVVPQTPPLARVADVELLQTGTWHISTGVFTFTPDDLTNAVAALGCPAVRRPVLKLGHTDPRFDGEPAVGYVDNMAVADAGRTLVGDYAGMPGWLGDVIASAYPDRSVEGEFDFRCQMGHTHPFVITAVALLGVEAPGVGSLESLQDVAALYGVDVAASAAPTGGTPVTVTASRKDDSDMPNPTPRQVAAKVTTEDVIRAFYASPLGSSWDAWVEELQLDPLQIIYVDDRSGARARVPVSISDGDGQEAVSFGDAVKVMIRYEDAPVAASAGREVIRFASRAEARHGQHVGAKAIQSHSTATSDAAWDGPGNEANLSNDDGADVYRQAYAWQDPDADEDKKNAYKFIHHEVSDAGTVGAASVQGCRAGIAVLNGARGGANIPDADVQAVWNHLAKHIRDSGAEPPELQAAAPHHHHKHPAAPKAGGPSPTEGAGMPATIREALGLAPDASDDEVRTAFAAQFASETPPEPPAPDGDEEQGTGEDAPPEETPPAEQEQQLVAASLPPEVREQLERQSRELAEIKAERATTAKKALFDGAVAAGKIAPTDRAAWESRYDKAPAVIEEILAATAKGAAVPVELAGQPGGEDVDSDEFAHLFPPARTGTEG